MAHELMGQRFLARSKPAWHNIAQEIFPEDMAIKPSDAMARIAGDLRHVRAPVFSTVEGHVIKLDKQIAVFRAPTHDAPDYHYLGQATDSWCLPSFTEMARGLDELSQYPVETAGILKQGGLAFLTLRGEGWDVKGDEMRSYFACNFSATPGIGHKAMHTPVRIVCWNTNTLAEAQASINLSIPHSADAGERIKLAATLIARFHDMQAKTLEIFTAFADRQLTSEEVDSILFAAFQLPSLPAKLKLIKQQLSETEAEVFKRALSADMLADLVKAQETYDRGVDSVLNLRSAALESFENFQPAHLRGTAWAAYNAVTEVADWREGKNAAESAMFGSRAKEKGRAFEAAMALVK